MLPRRAVLYDIPVMNIVIRDAVAADLQAIVGLLNAFITTTTYEYTDTPHTVASRAPWFARQTRRGFPVLVAETMAPGDARESGTAPNTPSPTSTPVVGFAAYGDFRDSVARPGYRFVVEHSVHVAEDAWGAGVGRLLMESLIDRAAANGVRTMIGAIDSSNVGSIEFHRRLGFVETARMPEVGYKHGQWLELVLVQRSVRK
jgi:L-amino acid N-acyltransferase YncA